MTILQMLQSQKLGKYSEKFRYIPSNMIYIHKFKFDLSLVIETLRKLAIMYVFYPFLGIFAEYLLISRLTVQH